MTKLSITLLGGFHARLEPGTSLRLPTRKSQALLAYLSVPLGRAHPRDALAALLWGGVRQEAARTALRQALFAIRKGLGNSGWPLRLVGETVALDPAGVEVDAVAFERAVGEGTPEGFDRAAALYHGDLLSGFAVSEPPFEEWLLAERERLRELALRALAQQLGLQRKAGASEAAVQTALRLLSLEPLQEPVHRTLMRLYAEQGRHGPALRQYQQCVSVLQRELGLEPEAETKALYQEILRHREAGPAPTDPTAASRGAAAPRGLESPVPLPLAEGALVGREDDVQRLGEVLAAAWAGRGQVLTVIGEAGIGKTRLIAELAAEAGRRGGRILLGRSHEGEQVLPFAPWVDALRSGPVIEELGGLPPVWRQELGRLLPQLVGGAVPPADRVADHLQLFESVVQAIARLAAGRRLLLVLEDLHWADDMSARLLAFVGRRLGTWPVLVATTVRDEELADVPALRHGIEDLQREGLLTQLPLGPLSRQDTMALVRLHARAGSDAAALAHLGAQAWAASEGNPFVIVELVRENAHGAAVAAVEGQLPPRVREIAARRLERVSRRGQDLAAVASVIGRDFDFALLQRAAGLEDREAAEGVEELVRRQILHGVGDGFAFVHDRLRSAVYETLLDVRRRMLHAAVAAALERVHAGPLDAVYDQLAEHYRRAEDHAKAAEYLTRFARRATRTYAHEPAVRAYAEALRQVDRLPAADADPRRLDIVPRLTRSLTFLGRFAEARDLLLAQRPRVEALDLPPVTAQFELLLSHVYSFLGDRAHTVESAARARAAAEKVGDETTMGKASYVLAMEGLWSGDPRAGIEHGRRSVALLESAGERWWLGQAHFAIAANHLLLGEFTPALEAAGRAATIGETLADPRVQTPAAWIAGTIHAMRGDWDEGIAAGRRSLEYSLDPLNRADALGWSGFAHLERGDVDEAVRLLEQSVEHWSEFGVRPAQGGFRILLGHACLMRGDLARAAALAEEGTAFTRETGYRLGVGWGERLLALIAERRGDRGRARALFEQALGTFTAISATYEAARTRLLLAETSRALGDEAAASAALEAARAAFAALEIPRYEQRAAALAGRREGERLPRWA